MTDGAARFLALHRPGDPLLMANAWDVGSARVLAAQGFQALATTSSGFAATRGRLDGAMGRDDVIAHGGEVAAAVDVPVSADLEHCFADDPAGVAATIGVAMEASLAGGSVEDATGRPDDPIYPLGLAVKRVAAAVDRARSGPDGFVVTARAEGLLHRVHDLDTVIERLLAFQAVGADVLFAPGLSTPDDVRQVVDAVDRPVNVLAFSGLASVAELAEAGVSRISVGGALAYIAYAAAADAAQALLAGDLAPLIGAKAAAAVVKPAMRR